MRDEASAVCANGHTGGRPRVVATYDYTDEAGRLLYQVVRYAPKDFRQRRPNGRGAWLYNLGNVRRVLYRLHELAAADGTRPVFVVEGEKDADALHALGLVATTAAMGAGKWRPEYSESLRGRRVIILPDNDNPGRQHAETVAKALSGIASSVAILELPDLAPKGDVSDWLSAGGNKEALLKLALECPAWGSNEAGGAGPEKVQEAAERYEAAFTNFKEEETSTPNGKRLVVRTGLPVATIGRNLMGLTSNWPKRVGSLLFVEGAGTQPLWLETADALFAWIGRKLDRGGFNQVCWPGGFDKVTKGEFFQYLQQTADDYDAVEAFPHWPNMPRTYYMHPATGGGDGKALRHLLARFNPATLVDGDLLRAFFLSLAWGGPAGQRPAWLFTAEDDDPGTGRGVGKSTVPKMGSYLFGGHIDGSANDPMDRLITRLLSSEGINRRVLLLDNIKTLRFSWSELEGLITNDVISGHRMYAGEGRRPNTLTYCLTLNGASLSRDMAQRCVIVKVRRPAYKAAWEEETLGFIRENRWAIIGDILEALKAPVGKLVRHSRWGAWEDAVLARVGDPAECQKVILERQESVDEDAAEADLVREAIAKELRDRGHDPEEDFVWIPSKDLANIVGEATGEKRSTNKTSAYLRTLGVPELRYSPRGNFGRGWTWRGKSASTEQPAVRITPRSEPAPAWS